MAVHRRFPSNLMELERCCKEEWAKLPKDREEIQPAPYSVECSGNNNLVLNTSKTKEVIVDYKRSRKDRACSSPHPRGSSSSVSTSIKFLGIHITSDLNLVHEHSSPGKEGSTKTLLPQEAETCWTLSPQLLTNFYRATSREHPSASVQQCGMAAALHKTGKT
ncbi:hypothetical protein L3Q82_003406 [Scortum barcoo]|uniref:Uncharacterized protein n=1 Tax=Scortum barcoo TaxID=214431 RepID=A0ACB8VNA4_9TELE|nr:hypothetical protein L3Q82_003406 [Scortum barcoo]